MAGRRCRLPAHGLLHAPQNGVTYVQDAIWRDRGEVEGLFCDGAHIYVCDAAYRVATTLSMQGSTKIQGKVASELHLPVVGH